MEILPPTTPSGQPLPRNPWQRYYQHVEDLCRHTETLSFLSGSKKIYKMPSPSHSRLPNSSLHFFTIKATISAFQRQSKITLEIMQSLTYLLPFLAVLPSTLAAPSKLSVRSAPICDQYSPVSAGSYAVQNDAWGKDAGSGSQCAQVDGLEGNSLSWSTTFSWNGGPNSIKSYANAENAAKTPCKPLNQYKSIPTTWSWRYVLQTLWSSFQFLD